MAVTITEAKLVVQTVFDSKKPQRCSCSMFRVLVPEHNICTDRRQEHYICWDTFDDLDDLDADGAKVMHEHKMFLSFIGPSKDLELDGAFTDVDVSKFDNVRVKPGTKINKLTRTKK